MDRSPANSAPLRWLAVPSPDFGDDPGPPDSESLHVAWRSWLRDPASQPEEPASPEALLWGCPSGRAARWRSIVAKAAESPAKGLSVKPTAAAAADPLEARTEQALGLLAAAWNLRTRGADSVGAGLWDVLKTLIARCGAAQDDVASRASLPFLWEAVEAPLVLAAHWPELKEPQILAQEATAALVEFLEQELDRTGAPRAALWPVWGAMLGSLARMQPLIEALPTAKQRFWTGRLSLVAGSVQLFQSGPRWFQETAETPAWKSALSELASGAEPAVAEAPSSTRARKRAASPAKPACETAFHSEWGRAALLSASEDPKASRVEVLWDAPDVTLRFQHRGRTWLAGPTTWNLSADPAAPASVAPIPASPSSTALPARPAVGTPEGWDCVCWEADEDVAYVELESRLVGGGRLQRQILLAHRDELLFLADALLDLPTPLAAEPTRTRRTMTASYTLPPVAWGAASPPHSEIRLNHGRAEMTAVPLTCGEWARDASQGRFEFLPPAEGEPPGERLVLSTAVVGRNAFSALVFDLDVRRSRRAVTWRPLTIAEERVVVPREYAVGGRFQFGTNHWLYYRSLGPAATRSLLGRHLVEQFLFARVTRKGLAETLLAIT